MIRKGRLGIRSGSERRMRPFLFLARISNGTFAFVFWLFR